MMNHNTPLLRNWCVVWLGLAALLLAACGGAPPDVAATVTFPAAPTDPTAIGALPTATGELPTGYPAATPTAELPTSYPAATTESALPAGDPGATAVAELPASTDAIYVPYIGQGAELPTQLTWSPKIAPVRGFEIDIPRFAKLLRAAQRQC